MDGSPSERYVGRVLYRDRYYVGWVVFTGDQAGLHAVVNDVLRVYNRYQVLTVSDEVMTCIGWLKLVKFVLIGCSFVSTWACKLLLTCVILSLSLIAHHLLQCLMVSVQFQLSLSAHHLLQCLMVSVQCQLSLSAHHLLQCLMVSVQFQLSLSAHHLLQCLMVSVHANPRTLMRTRQENSQFLRHEQFHLCNFTILERYY